MALRSTISKAVDTAFKKLGDLVISVTFVKKSSGSFNFETGTINQDLIETLVVDAVLLEETKQVKSVTQTTKQLIIKRLARDLTGYTDVSILGDTYKFKIAEGNEFVTIVDVIKGV